LSCSFTLHKIFFTDFAQFLHYWFGQVLIVESTFEPFANVVEPILGELGRARLWQLLAIRHLGWLK